MAARRKIADGIQTGAEVFKMPSERIPRSLLQGASNRVWQFQRSIDGEFDGVKVAL